MEVGVFIFLKKLCLIYFLVVLFFCVGYLMVGCKLFYIKYLWIFYELFDRMVVLLVYVCCVFVVFLYYDWSNLKCYDILFLLICF